MPVIVALTAHGERPWLILTGQHLQMLTALVDELSLLPDERLETMTPDQDLAELSSRVLVGVQGVVKRLRPRWLVVQGDTTSAAMGALAAFYEGVAVAHVEAGLRSGDPRNPFPEEMNRHLLGRLAGLHFAPTPRAVANLTAEGVAPERIHLVGNTVVDALVRVRDTLLPTLDPDEWVTPIVSSGRPLLLVTIHRRESFGAEIDAIAAAIAELARLHAGRLDIIYPVHLNPNVERPMRSRLEGIGNVHLLPPLPYTRFIQALSHATLVLTDSGGVQEEAAALGVPVLVARRVSERPEVVEAGVGELVGTDTARIVARVDHLLSDTSARAARAVPSTVFGDGRAAERIARLLLEENGSAGSPEPPSHQGAAVE
jgi:UDP-N-acetylglucosamine 2-epimerase (non-hydrolysing)